MTVTTDRDVYIAGEWLFFNLFLITDPSTGCSGNSKYAYLVLRDAGNEHISDNTIEIRGSSSFGSIYIPDTLTTGVYQIVAYTNFMRNYGEKAYFTKNIIVANRFDADFGFFDKCIQKEPSDSTMFIPAEGDAVSLNKTGFKQREKAKLGIKLPDGSKDALVSVVVRPVSPFVFVENNTKNESPDFNAQKYYYLPEVKGGIIQGSVLDENNNPISKLTVYLSTPDSIVNLQYSITDASGIFQFQLNSFYSGKLLYIKVVDVQKAKIILDSKFNLKNSFQMPSIKIEGDIKTYFTYLQKMVSTQKAYNQFYKTDIPTTDGPVYRPLVYLKPYSTVYPSDYTYLPDFIEISREIIPFLKTRLKNHEYTAEMSDLTKDIYVKPLIFLDGVLIDNIRQIIHLDTKSIYKIESVTNARFLGSVYLPSVLAVFSTNNELKKVKWTLPAATFQNTFTLPYSTYSSDNIGIKDKHTPDFRQLLYWNPSVKVNNTEEKNIEFTTSDCTGNFEVEIKGITSDGQILEFRKVINVTSNLNNR